MNRKLIALLFAVAIAPALYASQSPSVVPEVVVPAVAAPVVAAPAVAAPVVVAPAVAAESAGFFGTIKNGFSSFGHFYIGRDADKNVSYTYRRLFYTVPGTLLLFVGGYLTYKGYVAEGGYQEVWDIIKACVTFNGVKEYYDSNPDLVIAVYTGLVMAGVMAGNGVCHLYKWWRPGTPGTGTPETGTPETGTPETGTPETE